MQKATTSFSISGEQLLAMGPAVAKAVLTAKSMSQRAKLDAALARLASDVMLVRYTRAVYLTLPGVDSQIVLRGGCDLEADALVIVKHLHSDCTVTLQSQVEYEELR